MLNHDLLAEPIKGEYRERIIGKLLSSGDEFGLRAKPAWFPC
jgi:hypothetical protein